MAASAAGLTVDAPELRPDRPATVVVRLVNDDVEPYEGVELSLAGPWAVTPLAPGPDRLEPGESAEATWAVTAPSQREPATAGELHAGARFGGGRLAGLAGGGAAGLRGRAGRAPSRRPRRTSGPAATGWP